MTVAVFIVFCMSVPSCLDFVFKGRIRQGTLIHMKFFHVKCLSVFCSGKGMSGKHLELTPVSS